MNYIYYTFLAGWCADAAGARLEFRKRRFTEIEANEFVTHKKIENFDFFGMALKIWSSWM